MGFWKDLLLNGGWLGESDGAEFYFWGSRLEGGYPLLFKFNEREREVIRFMVMGEDGSFWTYISS